MERPDATTTAYYDAAVPEDPRARRGAMFGHPCAFVNGHMFFGTFAQSVVVRLGADRAAVLATGALRIFEPMPGRAWKEYVQVAVGGLPAAQLAALAREALAWTAQLPPKPAKAGAAKAGKAVVPAAKRAVPAKRPVAKVAKKVPAKKPAARKPMAKKAAAKKAAARKPAAKKPAAKRR